MKKVLLILIIPTLLSCSENSSTSSSNPMEGTWKLITGTIIENGRKTSVTDYTKDMSFIKIINKNHFAFLQHDLDKGQDSTPVFVAGGGRYTLKDTIYTEHLEYCSDRQWEGNDFTFTVLIKGDTLTQTGMEKVENLGINRLNIEKYVRLSK